MCEQHEDTFLFNVKDLDLLQTKLIVKLLIRYGIHDMNESVKMIYQTALRTPEDHSVVFLAHNGANRYIIL